MILPSSDGRVVRPSAPRAVDSDLIPSQMKPLTLKLVFTDLVFTDSYNGPLVQLLSAQAIGAGGLGFDSRAGQIATVSPTARRCIVFPELCNPGAKSRRWAPPLVTRFGVLTRV